MKRKYIILISLAVLALLILLFTWYFVYNKPHMDYAGAEAEFTLTADSLYHSYVADAAKADSLYTGAMLAVSGVTDKFEKIDTLTIAVFILGEGDFGPTGVRCTFMGTLPEEAYRPGKELLIKGFCTGYNDEDVILENCTLINSDES